MAGELDPAQVASVNPAENSVFAKYFGRPIGSRIAMHFCCPFGVQEKLAARRSRFRNIFLAAHKSLDNWATPVKLNDCQPDSSEV